MSGAPPCFNCPWSENPLPRGSATAAGLALVGCGDDGADDKMWEDDHLWVPLMLSGQRFSGKYIFEKDTMLDHDIVITGKVD